LARLSRFELDWRVANAFDQQALLTALCGCDVVLHAIAGDCHVILKTLMPVYRAAQAAGVSRLVYLSTASVHGQAPFPGTDETSALSDRQPLPYNNAKVQAEQRLWQLRAHGSVELVLLRPGIVLGPRSSWITNLATDLLAGQAYLLNEGQGICNSVYVDNLVHAIYLAMTVPRVDGEAFLIGDREQITWIDLYRPIAAALSCDLSQVARITSTFATPRQSLRQRAMLAAGPVRSLLERLPVRVRRAGRAALTALLEPEQPSPPSPWTLPLHLSKTRPHPVATLEMTMLQHCQYKLPHTKASRLLGYDPPVSFLEACRRTIGWLAFAGYPVKEHNLLLEPHNRAPDGGESAYG
jgi:nucleoside-diphosphate-sugar epimerase